MDHWIEQVGEPRRLILAWQAPDEHPDRVRWAVGELAKTASGAEFRYYGAEEFVSLNAGRAQQKLRDAGFFGYPAFDLSGGMGPFRSGVLEAFMRRLPPRSRPDFGRYLEHFRLKQSSSLTDLALLAATEARLPGDGFSLIDPLDPDEISRDLVFEIAGHRHNAASRGRLLSGQLLQLIPEPDNEHDVHAIRIEADGELVGRVNRLQARAVGKWLSSRSVHAWLLRLNGTVESPRAFAFLRMRPRLEQKAA